MASRRLRFIGSLLKWGLCAVGVVVLVLTVEDVATREGQS